MTPLILVLQIVCMIQYQGLNKMDSIPEFTLFNNETAILNELLPREIRKDTPTFVTLLEEYYRFLNQKDNPSYVIQRIIEEHDLDKVVDEKYLNKIQYEIARAIPTSSYVQKTFLLKRIIDSYAIRGNDESVLYFFRIFFNEDVTIYNPWERVLIPSHGKWTQQLKARIILYCGDSNILINNILVQYDNNGKEIARATVETAVRKRFRDKFYFDIVLRKDTTLGIFNKDYEISTIDGKARGIFVRSLAKVRIKNKGMGYSVGDKVYLGGLENITFSGVVDRVDQFGEIISIRLLNNGVSSSIHYFDSIPNDPSLLPNLSTIYISGRIIRKDDDYILVTRAENNNEFKLIIVLEKDLDFFEFHLNKFVDISGILTSDGIEVTSISDIIDENYVLHDFKYYDKNITPNYKINNSNYQTLDNTIIATNKLYDEETLAKFEFQFSILYLTDGFYDDENGRPSGFNVLQDSFYYQVFSYEINSSLSINTWKKQLEELIHPAGFKLFNSINTIDILDLDLDFFGNATVDTNFLPPSLQSIENFAIISSVNAIAQTYNYSTLTPLTLPAIPDIDVGPYFAEDYTTTLEINKNIAFVDIEEGQYNLVFTDNEIQYDLVFNIGFGTNFGKAKQGITDTELDPYYDPYNSYYTYGYDSYGLPLRSSFTIFDINGIKFSNGYYYYNGYNNWIKQ
jgi:hypothetical protein